MKVRVSYGTAIAMGLVRAKMMARPTTAYLMTYWPGRCRNDCAFCAQARSSNADWERLSRITWPPFELEEVLEALPGGGFSRVCLQTVDYPGLVEDVITLLSELKSVDLPVSLSITPVEDDALREFRRLGVDYVGIGLDAASERLFAELKRGLYSWGEMWDFTERVLDTFGRGRAFVHSRARRNGQGARGGHGEGILDGGGCFTFRLHTDKGDSPRIQKAPLAREVPQAPDREAPAREGVLNRNFHIRRR